MVCSGVAVVNTIAYGFPPQLDALNPTTTPDNQTPRWSRQATILFLFFVNPERQMDFHLKPRRVAWRSLFASCQNRQTGRAFSMQHPCGSFGVIALTNHCRSQLLSRIDYWSGEKMDLSNTTFSGGNPFGQMHALEKMDFLDTGSMPKRFLPESSSHFDWYRTATARIGAFCWWIGVSSLF